MQLLDAALAFVLTMAAMATVVTVIMESCIRIARIRKKNLVQTMSMLAGEMEASGLSMDKEELWEFLVRVIKNPSEPTFEKIKDRCMEFPAIEDRLKFLGPDRVAGLGPGRRLTNFISQIFGDAKRAPVNDNVSLEYLLRSLAETGNIRSQAHEERQSLTLAFNRIARKYEEIGAAVSSGFKRRAQAWSIGIGISFALACNINGLTIFKTFLVDPKLASAVIQYQDIPPASGAGQTGQENAESVQKALAELKGLGIPMGYQDYPGIVRPVFKDGEFLLWFFQVGLTGILIGLGAPFWFDVAKRLSQIRKGVQSDAASKEFRFSMGNANGNAERRREIVSRVLADAALEAGIQKKSANPAGP